MSFLFAKGDVNLSVASAVGSDLVRITGAGTPRVAENVFELPTFPEFTPLRLSHRPLITQFTKDFPPFADYTFVSLYSWNIRRVVALSNLYGNLVVRFSDDTTNKTFFSFLGTCKVDKTIETLLRFIESRRYTSALSLIPQPVIDALPLDLRHKYTIHEDPDNNDYILSVSDLCKFNANKFRQRKTNYRKFVQAYGDRITSGLIDLTAPGIPAAVESLLASWRRARGKSQSATRNEFLAIRRCLAHDQRLGIQAYGTYLDGDLVALNLFEIRDDMAYGHFMKVNTEHRGVSEHLVYEFAKYLQARGVTHINIQQDLGIEGLRAYKMSYRPVYFLKKYVISHLT